MHRLVVALSVLIISIQSLARQVSATDKPICSVNDLRLVCNTESNQSVVTTGSSANLPQAKTFGLSSKTASSLPESLKVERTILAELVRKEFLELLKSPQAKNEAKLLVPRIEHLTIAVGDANWCRTNSRLTFDNVEHRLVVCASLLSLSKEAFVYELARGMFTAIRPCNSIAEFQIGGVQVRGPATHVGPATFAAVSLDSYPFNAAISCLQARGGNFKGPISSTKSDEAKRGIPEEWCSGEYYTNEVTDALTDVAASEVLARYLKNNPVASVVAPFESHITEFCSMNNSTTENTANYQSEFIYKRLDKVVFNNSSLRAQIGCSARNLPECDLLSGEKRGIADSSGIGGDHD